MFEEKKIVHIIGDKQRPREYGHLAQESFGTNG